jgi:hypothetical protein
MMGLLIVLAILTVIYLQDDTIKTSEDLEKEFGIIPLSVIPEGKITGFENEGEQKKRHSRSRKGKYE